jgi:hypothetical protein
MCLVRSNQIDEAYPIVQETQISMNLSSVSQDKASHETAKTQPQDHGYNKFFTFHSTDLEPRPIQESSSLDVVASSFVPDSVPEPSSSHTSASTAIATCTTAKEFTNEKKGKKNNPIIIVQHDYHDHSQREEIGRSQPQKLRGGVSTPFPLKLHELLKKAMAEGHGDIVSWQPHGRCFVVYKARDFQDIILPKYFKLRKISSFQRQLNLYGFQRLTFGRDRGGYYHELFLRNKEFLAHEIRRVQVKGTRVRARSNPEQEPNFWTMQWCKPKITAATSKDENVGTCTGGLARNIPPASNAFVSLKAARVNETLTTPILKPIQPIREPVPASCVSGFCDNFRNFDHNRQRGSYGGFRSGSAERENPLLSFGDRVFHSVDPFQPLFLEENSGNASNEIADNSLDARSFNQSRYSSIHTRRNSFE